MRREQLGFVFHPHRFRIKHGQEKFPNLFQNVVENVVIESGGVGIAYGYQPPLPVRSASITQSYPGSSIKICAARKVRNIEWISESVTYIPLHTVILGPIIRGQPKTNLKVTFEQESKQIRYSKYHVKMK